MTIFLPNPRTSLLPALAASFLVGCGGGGASSGSSGGGPVVASAVAGTASYSRTLTLTLTGIRLDQGVSVAATGCTGVAIVAASSSATSATYQCTVSAMGAGQFVVTPASGGATLATASFTVPAPQVTLDYSNGSGVTGALVLTLSPDKTPITVNNFLSYVNGGFYAGTVIHRVSPGFVIQGGGYTAPFNATTQSLKATGAPIALEVGKGLSNTQWTIAMARGDAPDSATSQFFINLVDNSGKNDPGVGAGYAVFGSVTGDASTAGVSNIAAAPCVALPLVLLPTDCAPTPNIVITAATQTL